MTDEEIGQVGDLPWDGIPGPKIVEVNGQQFAECASFLHVDYVESALSTLFSTRLTSRIDAPEYERRVLTMALAYRAMAGQSDISRIRNELYVLSFQETTSGNSELQDTSTIAGGIVFRIDLCRVSNIQDQPSPSDHRKRLFPIYCSWIQRTESSCVKTRISQLGAAFLAKFANQNDTEPTCQLLVLGAGPAGCAAAIAAAMSGMSVAIIERSEFPRHRPGEALHPGMRLLFKQLGIEREIETCNFVTFEGIWREIEGDRTFTRFGPAGDSGWLGLQAIRSEFDSVLLNRAKQLGVKILQPVKAVAPIKTSDNRVVGIETSHGRIYSRFVVDAGGGNHWLARRLGQKINTYSPVLIANYGYESSCAVSDSQLPMIRNEVNGWVWHAKVRDGCYQWVNMSWTDSMKEKPLANNSRAANVTWRRAEILAGSGFFVVGDAAVVLDPGSSHGVLRAVMSGIMSAHVAQQIQDAPSQQEQLLNGYCEWLSDWFEHDVQSLGALYSTHPNSPIWVSNFSKATFT